MAESPQAPRISRLSWGRVEVEGHGNYKDVKLYPGGCRAWDWRETGTGHVPGIQPADVEELLQHGAAVAVLSSGVYGRLQVCPETMQLLKDRGITVHLLRTREAVRVYNECRERGPVGGLIHSTC
ncbi:MAG: Mth938-like domain-containing protein [Fidelibacterota bacterium]|nr:MAG: Mth938-like domain-containing protein [Candidatus Neomarinimicrobiota bacterium]